MARDYNSLFRGVRGLNHRSRYLWLRRKLNPLHPTTVLELGCFDAKTLDYIPWRPVAYFGFDAGWEGGLALAQLRLRGHSTAHAFFCEVPEQLRSVASVGVCMETLEHVPEVLVEPYVEKLSQCVSSRLFVTLPVEFGPSFAIKRAIRWFAPRLRDTLRYSASEFIWATLGVTERVRRDQHRGFDYRKVVEILDRHFDVVAVENVIPFLPTWLGTTVGIVACRRMPQTTCGLCV